MISGADDGIEIAGGAAMGTRVAFAGDANALSVASAGLDADFERLGMRDRAVTVAGWAGREIFAGAVAAWALDVELHASTGLRDLAGAVALGAFARGFERALSVALRADILARDVEAHDAAANRRPEWNVYLIFEIGARFGAFLRGRTAAASAKDSRENVAEASASSARRGTLAALGVIDEVGEIEPAEIEVNAALPARLRASRESAGKTSEAACTGCTSACVGFRSGRIDVVRIEADLVVNFALLGIAEDFVGLGDGLELLLRRFVAGVYVGMIFAGELAKGFTDVLGRGELLPTENLVVILFRRGCHV